jgi:hypothetical protein
MAGCAFLAPESVYPTATDLEKVHRPINWFDRRRPPERLPGGNRSPDAGAKRRNPGRPQAPGAPSPDSASLHPGYIATSRASCVEDVRPAFGSANRLPIGPSTGGKRVARMQARSAGIREPSNARLRIPLRCIRATSRWGGPAGVEGVRLWGNSLTGPSRRGNPWPGCRREAPESGSPRMRASGFRFAASGLHRGEMARRS